jgi:hypothetical protein
MWAMAVSGQVYDGHGLIDDHGFFTEGGQETGAIPFGRGPVAS